MLFKFSVEFVVVSECKVQQFPTELYRLAFKGLGRINNYVLQFDCAVAAFARTALHIRLSFGGRS